MLKRLAVLALCAAGMLAVGDAVVAGPSKSGPIDVHTLSLMVSVDGKQVMTPVIGMAAGAPALVSVASDDLDGYTLTVDIIESDGADAREGVGAQFVLWRGTESAGVKLLDDVLVLGGDRRIQDQEPILRAESGGVSASITVVSYATHAQAQQTASANKSCAGAVGLPGSPALKGNGNCCTSKCQDGSGNSLKCCNVLQGCCQCGTCCKP